MPKMKLIYIANTTLPTKRAHGLQIMKMCAAFTEAGLETKLVVPRRFPPKELKGKDPFEYYRVEKKFRIKRVFCLDLIVLDRLLGPVAFFIQSFSFSFFLVLYLLFQKNALLYSRDRIGLFFASLFFKNTVFEIHKINRRFFWGPVKRAKKIVVISRGLKEELVKGGVPENKILVAGDGVEARDFVVVESAQACRQKLNLPPEEKLVVYTGHLYDWKGVETLALASRFLPEGVKVVLVGGLPGDLARFEKLIKKENLSKVLLLGHKDHGQIPFFLKAADCLVLTGTRKSRVSEKFTSPMKMFEYLAAQKPIVASDLPSFREVLNEQNAVLVEPDDPRALAEGVKNVLTDQKLSEKISAQAMEDVQRYSWSDRAKIIREFISERV